MVMIEAQNLTKAFGERIAVRNLTFGVDEGEVLGLLGPNGAGKTTTIRMLAGIIAPTSGNAQVAGISPDGEPERLHESIGLLTESPGFYERMSALSNLEYFAGFYSEIDARRQVEKYLRQMGLWDRRQDKVGAFSKGMKQKLALARALLHEPRVLFLDEPTAGLDPEAAQEVRKMISELSQQGRTILLSTHNLAEAEQLCRRIAVIRTGLLALDTPGALRQRLFRRRAIVNLEAAERLVMEAVQGLSFVSEVNQDGNQLIIELAEYDTNLPQLVKCIVDAGGRVLGVSEDRHSLEDIYLTLVREESRDGS